LNAELRPYVKQPDPSPEVYIEVIIPGYRAMKPAPKIAHHPLRRRRA
jgi:hypothetical protein